MTVKTITQAAYDSLAALKNDGETFSDVVRRLNGSRYTEPSEDGGQNGVYAALGFVHSTNADCTVESGYSVTSTVYAYVGGTGGDVEHGFLLGQDFPGPGGSDEGDNVGIGVQYQFVGQYNLSPSGGVSLEYFVPSKLLPDGVVNDVYYSGNDPVTSPPALEPGVNNPELISVPAGSTAAPFFYANGTLELQFGVELSFGVGVGDRIARVTVSPDVSLGVTGNLTTLAGIQCVADSTSSSSAQYFEIYAQGGLSAKDGVEFHIWQCTPASGGGQPNSCTPTDVP